MKTIIIVLSCMFLLVSCEARQLMVIAPEKQDVNGFREPTPNEWADYIIPVREYLYLRTQAVVKNDISVLWNKYPNLKSPIRPKDGINSERYEVESLNRSFTFIDANFSEEGYGRLKMKEVSNTEIILLVHGGIGYLRHDFQTSGGELLIELYLEYDGNEWNIIQSDEYMLPEYKEWVKKSQ
ncbi:hypothetical protein ACFSCX_13105 [Bacillus salitolerans]|uniref:Lipoprotein n=1 Tax=Bacillus salitolerans TaxID=1437434 RepID=A0ABW4LR10_9BACI